MKAALQKDNQTANELASREFSAPDVNILETKEGYVLEAEIPGVNREGLEISLDGNELTIVGRRSAETVNGEPIFRERRLADFRRTFELDPAIDTRKIAARVNQGVLTLTLPKSERVKPRKIVVE